MAKTHSKTIRIRTRNLSDVSDFVTQEIPRLYRGVFVEAVSLNLVQALKIEPNYKYVSRMAAYGKTFVSAKQRRYVMAHIREGSIRPGVNNRTGGLAAGWHVEHQGSKAAIVNNTEAARWTMNDYWQARQPAAVGWRKSSAIIEENIDAAMVDAIDDVVKAMEAR